MGGRRKDFLALYLIMISLTSFLSGCAQGVYHMEINQDGSTDLHIKVGLDEKVRSLTNGWDPLGVFRSKLEQNRFKVDDYHKDDYTGVMASKHYQSMKSMMDDLHGSRKTTSVKSGGKEGPKGNSQSFDYQSDEAFFYTTYKIKGRVDVPLLLQEQFGVSSDRLGGFAKSIGDQFLDQLDLKAKLTLPYRFGVKHNATAVEDNGKTLVWVFDPADVNLIKLELSIPNVRNIVATAIGGFVVASFIVLMVTRYRKYKSK